MFHVMRYPDSEGGNTPAVAVEEKTEFTEDEWYERAEKNNFPVTNLNMRVGGFATAGLCKLTENDARCMLANACRFLNQVVGLASGVLDSISPAHLREIVGHDIALPHGIIRADRTASLKETPPKPDLPDRPFDFTQGRDGRKNPRGRKHPLVALIELAAKAAKLLEKIAGGLAPESMDREPLASRKQARKADLDARYAAIDQKREDSNNKLFR